VRADEKRAAEDSRLPPPHEPVDYWSAFPAVARGASPTPTGNRSGCTRLFCPGSTSTPCDGIPCHGAHGPREGPDCPRRRSPALKPPLITAIYRRGVALSYGRDRESFPNPTWTESSPMVPTLTIISLAGSSRTAMAIRHGGIDESCLHSGDVDGELLLGDLVSQSLQVPSNERLRRPVGRSTSIGPDAGDGRDSVEVSAAPCQKVSHGHIGHRCEAGHIDRNRLGLRPPGEIGILMPDTSRDDHEINATSMMTADWPTTHSLLPDDTRVMGFEWVWHFVLSQNRQKQLGPV
jgi:hypothetical protein